MNLLTVRADKNGNMPRDITQEFLDAARAGHYETAKKHWTAEGIQNYESNLAHGGFNGFCDKFTEYPNYKLTASTPSKGGRWLELFWYDENNEKTKHGWMFFFRKIDDRWYIVQ